MNLLKIQNFSKSIILFTHTFLQYFTSILFSKYLSNKDKMFFCLDDVFLWPLGPCKINKTLTFYSILFDFLCKDSFTKFAHGDNPKNEFCVSLKFFD